MMQEVSVAVVYLARGADSDWMNACVRFIDSYRRYASGVIHTFYVIFKGYSSKDDLNSAEKLFDDLNYTAIHLEDESYDIGAYIELAKKIHEDFFCVFNTASEILTEHWLKKLLVNLLLPNVGLVGATGSYETLNELNFNFPIFPNVHVRSNAFMMQRKIFSDLMRDVEIHEKIDAYFVESGKNSLTNKILALGLQIRIVGKNGRGYAPEFWGKSDTFRQGRQSNLLVSDNQTRAFTAMPWPEKREFFKRTWGK